MYGKYVTLTDGKRKITVWVWGVPGLTNRQWERGAKRVVRNMKLEKTEV